LGANTIPNPKVEFKKIKFRFQTSDKSFQIQPSKEIQVSDALLLGS
jgi:hypothetical protein